MSPIAFAHPEWAAALSFALAACAVALLGARARARRRRRTLGVGPSAVSGGRDAALLLAGIAIAVALLGPRFGEAPVRMPSGGVDVVFLLDVSRSMDARDVPPSRLDRARRAVEEIVGRLSPDDRVALAAFAGRGLLLSPLTPDHDALIELLPGVDTGLIAPPSSKLDAGLAAAATAFEAASERPRVVVVASDGEDPDRREVGELERMRALGIRVATIALGSDAGDLVPDDGRPLLDRDGALVRSRRERERLASVSRATGGPVFVGDRFGRIDFARAADAIRHGPNTAGGRIGGRGESARSTPFAALAFLLLLIEALPPGARIPRRWPPFATAAVVAALLAAGAHGADAPGRADHQHRAATSQALETAAARVAASPEDARARIAFGIAALDAGRNEDAIRAFQAAGVFARDGTTAATAQYDLGVAALALGDHAGARDAFFAALELDPADEEARFNLEWTLRRAEPGPTAPPERAAPPPDASEPRERPQPAQSTPRERANGEAAPVLPELSDAQRRRWLERAQDDPSSWLRAASEAVRAPSARGERPAW